MEGIAPVIFTVDGNLQHGLCDLYDKMHGESRNTGGNEINEPGVCDSKAERNDAEEHARAWAELFHKTRQRMMSKQPIFSFLVPGFTLVQFFIQL